MLEIGHDQIASSFTAEHCNGRESQLEITGRPKAKFVYRISQHNKRMRDWQILYLPVSKLFGNLI